MSAFWTRITFLVVFYAMAGEVRGQHFDRDGLPVLFDDGDADRHVEALGTRSGIWGSLNQGFEGWVYPFKAFSDLEWGLIGPDGVFQSIRGDLKRHGVSPCASRLEFRGEDWQLVITLMAPRGEPGGWFRFQSSLPTDVTLALRLRPVLVPMHREGAGRVISRWDREAGVMSFGRSDIGATLAFAAGDRTPEFERLGSGAFEVRLDRSVAESGAVYFALLADGAGNVEESLRHLRDHQDRLIETSERYFSDLIERLPLVETPDPEVNRALLWAGISLAQLRLQNPDLGWGLVSGYSGSGDSTRPKYAWYFEEPTLASWAYHRLGLSGYIREALQFLSRYHRADGKTVHEVTQSLRYWPGFLDEFRYAYMHTDGPVYYLVAYGHYLRSTGDLEFIQAHRQIIHNTFRWCLSRIDETDGLIIVDRGDWGSAESSTEILKDTQLEAMWLRALHEVAYLGEALGDENLVSESRALSEKVRRAIETQFWDDAKGYYIWGMNRAGDPVSSFVPHHAVGFWLSDLRSERVSRALRVLAGSEFMTDWGARSLSLTDPRYDERSYQSGSVWPVWNAGVLISDFQRGRSVRGFQNWRAMVAARFQTALGPMPEVFRGDRLELLPEAVPHQMFSEVGIVNGLFDGLLGLAVDVPGRKLTLAPRLPLEWRSVKVSRMPFGNERFNLEVVRQDKRLTIRLDGALTSPISLGLRPEIAGDALVRSVEEGDDVPYFRIQRGDANSQVVLERSWKGGDYELEIIHSKGHDFIPEGQRLRVGEPSQNLRLIDYASRGSWWEAVVEGRPGMRYRLRFSCDTAPSAIEGGVLQRMDGERCVIQTMAGPGLPINRAGYARWPIRVKWRPRSDRTQLLDSSRHGSKPGTKASRVGWGSQVERIRDDIQRVAGRLPGAERKVPLDVTLVREEDCGSYVRRLIEYQAEPGSRVPAYLCVPKNCLTDGVRAFGILCLHPTDNLVGHKVVVGLGGRAGRNYAEELAMRGFVTLSPSYPLLANYQPDLKALGYESGTMKAIWDNQRAIDLLLSLDFVRPDYVGAIGHSLGGHNALFTAVFDERIRAVATSCGFDSFLDYKGGDIRGWTSSRYMPRLLEFGLEEIPFDFHEIVAALAPRALFVSAPLGDTNFQWESVDRVAAAASSVYELWDAEKHLVVRHPDCGHDFPMALREEAYGFLGRHLAREASDQ